MLPSVSAPSMVAPSPRSDDGGAPTGPVRVPTAASIRIVVGVWSPMLLWFAAFRPGIMSADSLAHWGEATEGGWTDLHPPAYTALMWVSASVAGSPSLLALGQSLLLAAALVAAAQALVRLGAPRRATLVVTGALAATPMVGAVSVSLWKDVPYTGALLFAVARVLDVAAARADGDSAGCRSSVISCALWLGAAALLRQNGLMFALPLLLLVSLLVREVRRLCLVLASALLVMVVSVKAVVFPAAGVRPSPAFATLATFSHDIAAVAADDPGSFDADERALLERVAPFESWRAVYQASTCSSLNWVFDPSFHWDQAEGAESEYLYLWSEVLAGHPGRVLGNRLCVGAIAWRPVPSGSLYTVGRGVDPNDYGLETVPVVRAANQVALDLLDVSDEASVQWLAWRAPPWIYVAYVLVGVAAWRRRQLVLLLAVAPLAAQQLSVLPLNPAQDARYMIFSLVYAVMLLPFALSRLAHTRPRAHSPACRHNGESR